MYLAAAGVGTIGIADFDVVALSNLQRQILYTIHDIGKNKAAAAQERLSALNQNVTFQAITEKIVTENVLDILSPYDIVVDGSDNFATRYLLNDACVILKKPLVYGAIFKFEGQVSVFNWQEGPTYRCLFPEPPLEGEMLSCGEIGVLGVLPGIIGTWQATETIKLITGIGQPLSGKLLRIDLLGNQLEAFEFNAIAANKCIDRLDTYHNDICDPSIAEIDKNTLMQWLNEITIQLIDVRELSEYETFNIGGKHIALSTLHQRMDEIDPAIITVVHCQSGARSKQAINIIRGRYSNIKLYNLKRGLLDFQELNVKTGTETYYKIYSSGAGKFKLLV
jgi:adenylyltransferase/sulfurtransferase